MSSEPNFFGATVPAEGRPGQFRCTELWFPDGSIILQSENILFRVYSGLLSLHSPLFRDLFSLPQPPASDQEVYEGVSVVEMADTANELYYLLKAQQNPTSILITPTSNLEITLILLHMGTKYDVSTIRNAAVSVLKTIFPSTLKGWDESANVRDALAYDHWVWEFAVANSAREHSLRSILPAALHSCSRFKLTDIYDGFTLGNTNHSINPEDKRVLLISKAKLNFVHRTQTYKFVEEDLNSGALRTCHTSQECRKFRKTMRELIDEKEENQMDPRIILIPKAKFDLFQVHAKAAGYCDECLDEDARIFREEREKIWEKLPSLFDLPPWNELIAADRTHGMDVS